MFNARSIRDKFLDLRALVATENPDLVAITESWLKTSSRDFEGEFEIPGYQLFHKDRNNKEGGGVLLYVKNSINAVDCSIASEYEILGVDLRIGSAKYTALLVCRPPRQLAEQDRDIYTSY